MWKSDFTNLLRNTFPDVFGVFQQVGKEELQYTPKLRFERLKDDNHYRVILIGNVDVEVLKMDIEAEDIENADAEPRVEGKAKIYYGKRYERDPYNRKRAIEIHGLNCVVCSFNFEEVYGERGKDFIEVHHVKPLSSLAGEEEIDPKSDLVPLCANCHRMVHRRYDEVLSVHELKQIVRISY
ncbi:HNH endonuclease [Ammoniphilus sp. 3BR4]|uniref:HNH endonuclease n=1 Tax=Ammoniphilus sp. 3BR4 TaxID=3158265 RepID=UPI0034651BE1